MDPGIIGVFIPIVAIVIGGIIAVTTMLTNHQRKMAELYRRDAQQPGLLDEIRAMRAEMADLRDRVNQQTLMLESRQRLDREVLQRTQDQ
jgi:hypothetical protein